MQLENSEQALLSCIIKKGELIKEIALNEEHFEYVPHKKIFQAMRQLERKEIPIDIVSLNTELGNEIIFIGGSSYLADLYNIMTNEENFKQYEQYVFEEFQIRKTKEITQTLSEVNSPRDIEKLKQAIAEINETLDHGQESDFDLSEVLYSIHDDVETKKEGINGIPTGFVELDNLLDGLSEEELLILAARPSVGKTAFSLAIANNAMKNNHFVNFFSLEMSDKSLLTRMLCSIGGINSMKIKNALKRFDEEDWKRYQAAQGILSNYKHNLDICDKSKVTVQEIRSRTKKNIRKHPDKRHLVIIDYLTLIQGSGRRERHLEVGEVSRNLKRMARDLNVPVILLSQLSRGVEQRQDKRPMLSDLRDSGEIEQDADKILFLHRDDYYDKDTENKNIIEVIVSKNRNGSLGVAQLAYLKESNTFLNLERRYDG
ncbi:replicative DNA helicase [Bacillus sp. DTU_2020_1000418_1_SI_GHA_SEK_038]|uniref:replicative DNA helicase n=1 Tax=Bacillus sp. DTU_2020_1000418_1_SI_GHA_SEK_038 TaxID=3077585 RepID=UPI0028E4EB94|nr:replicative DNA helicase [Bacillus sp. DTU_2020_1000418_1_SI_GHA_SEK_038]WNS74262.1 replicative DNA helicase [Bacillus sp. DTU_2020_1000418_1_SI_GHA_SEK_038]